MNSDYTKHNIIKYLSPNQENDIWGMSINSIGFQSIKPQENYPPKGHPMKYTFNTQRGRTVNEFIFVYITKGEGKFQSANCPEKEITKGDAFLLFPEDWHTYQPSKETGWDEYFVTFQGEYAHKLFSQIIRPETPILHIGINEQIVKHFVEMLDCAIAQKAGYQAVLTGIMMHITGLIYSISQSQDFGSESMQKIQEACILMQKNIYEKFTPEDTARSLNMSYSNFRKSFKQHIGIAPHQYMLQLKLVKIKELLGNTEMSIQDIAIKLNFESADYFSYFFRNKTNINPLSYRKEIEKQRSKAKLYAL
ncbi:MAG: AraC family transcriptional regulator [Parabacteroides sp.]|nr:AraC family transcriptional regulator [Parabacteroides sp.]